MPLVKYFLSLILVFVLEKLLFMIYASETSVVFSDMIRVIWHGLPVDLAVAAYLSLIPLLLTIAGLYLRKLPVKGILSGYNIVVSLTLALIFVGDAAVYPYFGYKLDSSVLFYLRTPKEALASIPSYGAVLGMVSVLAFAALVFFILNLSSRGWGVFRLRKWQSTAVLIASIPILFIISRGGVKKSCMNVGHAYFSDVQFLNHSAVNPAFNFFDSLGSGADFASMYVFHDEADMARLTEGEFFSDPSIRDSLLNTSRPNVLFIILESFGEDITPYTPNLDSLKNTGVSFTNCYAGSFRTDRGVVCTLNGFPGLPVTSLMKLPVLNSRLPSVAKSLAENGYSTSFLYGGDVNFTNMKSYLYAGGYQSVVSDVDFPVNQRGDNPWGVNDEHTFDRLYDSILASRDSLWHMAFLSLSSHEPFNVPFSRYEEAIPNSFAYTDDCLGRFIRKLSATPIWDNLLVVITPDHGYCYPSAGLKQAPHAHHIPVLWTGGAVRRPVKVETLMNQSDLAATLLAQMGIDASGFRFSRNVLSEKYSAPSVFYSYIDGFCYIDATGASMYDNVSSRGEYSEGEGDSLRLEKGKAVLQLLYGSL